MSGCRLDELHDRTDDRERGGSGGRGGSKPNRSGSRAAKWVSVDELTRVRPLSGDDRSAAHIKVVVRVDPNRRDPPSLSGPSGPSESAEHVWVEAELVDAVPGTPPPGARVSVRISQAAFGARAPSPFGVAAPAFGAPVPLPFVWPPSPFGVAAPALLQPFGARAPLPFGARAPFSFGVAAPAFGAQTGTSFGTGVFGASSASSTGPAPFGASSASSTGSALFGASSAASFGSGMFGASSAASTGSALFGASSAASFGTGALFATSNTASSAAQFGTPSAKTTSTLGSSGAGMPKSWPNCKLKQFNGKEWTTLKGSLGMDAASGVDQWKLVAQENGTPTPIDHTNAQPGKTDRQILLSGTAVLVAPDVQSREDILNERNQKPNARSLLPCVGAFAP
jgi:hypothetical protein